MKPVQKARLICAGIILVAIIPLLLATIVLFILFILTKGDYHE